jgi:hypothetical protein
MCRYVHRGGGSICLKTIASTGLSQAHHHRIYLIPTDTLKDLHFFPTPAAIWLPKHALYYGVFWGLHCQKHSTAALRFVLAPGGFLSIYDFAFLIKKH